MLPLLRGTLPSQRRPSSSSASLRPSEDISASRAGLLLFGVLLLTASLCAAYANWGLPGLWHPDEITGRSVGLVLAGTANPEFFKYPTLHIYLVAVLTVVPYLLLAGPAEEIAATLEGGLVPAVTLYARLLTALMGTLTVLIVYKAAALIFDTRTALISALCLALTAGFVGLSHFATVDIPSVFWMCLAFYCSLLAVRADTRKQYAIAGLVSGLAISTKYSGLLILAPVLLAYFLNTRPPFARNLAARVVDRSLLWLGGGVVTGFLIGTPYALITPVAFVKDFVQINMFQPSYAGEGGYGFLPHLENLWEIFGPFLFVSAALGLFYVVVLTVRFRTPEGLLLLVTIFVVYAKMGSMMFHPMRYIMPLVPLLAICAGKLVSDLLLVGRGTAARAATLAVVIGGLAFSFQYALAGVAEIGNDDRVLAQRWVLERVPGDATVEMSPNYAINVTEGHGRFRPIPYYHEKETFIRMKQSALYQRLSGIYLKIQALSGTLRPEMEEKTRPPEIVEPPEVSLEALLERKPRFLILARRSYRRFLSEEAKASEYFPLQHRLYSSVLAGETPYRLLVDFAKADAWRRPELEFIHAGIRIYEYRE